MINCLINKNRLRSFKFETKSNFEIGDIISIPVEQSFAYLLQSSIVNVIGCDSDFVYWTGEMINGGQLSSGTHYRNVVYLGKK